MSEVDSAYLLWELENSRSGIPSNEVRLVKVCKDLLARIEALEAVLSKTQK